MGSKSRCQLKKGPGGTSLVLQWLRVCLPMQGTWVRSLVWEDPTWQGAAKPRLQLLEPSLCPKRSHSSEKPSHLNQREPPPSSTRESPRPPQPEREPPPSSTRESPCTAMQSQHSRNQITLKRHAVHQQVSLVLPSGLQPGLLLGQDMAGTLPV